MHKAYGDRFVPPIAADIEKSAWSKDKSRLLQINTEAKQVIKDEDLYLTWFFLVNRTYDMEGEQVLAEAGRTVAKRTP